MHNSAYTNDQLTIAATFDQRVSLTPNKTAYIEYNQQSQQWENYSWLGVRNQAAAIQKWLLGLGLSSGDRLALMIPNSVMWVAIDQAAAGLGIITVPLYPNDREDNVHYILEKTDCKLLLIDNYEQYELSKDFLHEIDALQFIVSIHDIEQTDLPVLKKLLNLDDEISFHTDGCQSSDPATIVFTSGTTGRPKGVVLSHRNILVNAADCCSAVPVTESDRLLSFLPLSHTFERTTGYYAPMLQGAEIAYTRSIDQLAEDLQVMQPTILISVPRIYERVFAKIEEQVQQKSKFAQTLFKAAHQIGYKKFCYQQKTGPWSLSFFIHPLLDLLVAKKIRSKLGGKLKFAVAGGAAFGRDLNAFFIGMGVNVLQGYGMTESSPVISANRMERNIVGSVGEAFDHVDVKLSDVDELLVRGDSIMLGYWDNEEATNKVLTSDGWLHTGDIARIENDIIFITGRVKDIIVLSNGEKIPPADIEHAVSADALFDQAIVIGERKPFLSAIVVLNAEQCKLQGINTNNMDDENLKSELLKRISAHMNDFPGYAQIYQITATLDPWEVENGMLTPTLKIKREKVKELFEQKINKMYEGH